MYIADLHIHSRYSRATSRDLDAPHLDLWARRKGIRLVGTGDFTHPAWRAELAEALEPAEEGLYRLKEGLRLPCEVEEEGPRFAVTGEISTIYKKDGKTRKVHSLILLPSLEAAEKLSARLETIGNIRSDGRPILGLDCRDLLEITLESCPEAVFIPAHIWTPHFSVLGAFSGFESMEACFGDMAGHIHAVETGLSSDPPMNWRVSALDGRTLVSNSDAHSPAKLGREANVLEGELSYPALARAICTGEGFWGTLEFFPEEGKYHLDGHRNCGVCLEPGEAIARENRCPVCGKPITVGVLHRVEALADRPEGVPAPGAKPFECLVPLAELLAASLGASEASRRVQEGYFALLGKLGSELHILRECDLADVEQAAGFAVAEGVRRLRAGQVERKGGFDGEYGSISLFAPGELARLEGQMALFDLAPSSKKAKTAVPKPAAEQPQEVAHPPVAAEPNLAQQRAVEWEGSSLAVVAGPGTGKTRTLVERIVHLIQARGVKPSEITAVTFTNQAAAEMRTRLEERLGGKRAIRGITIGTFHAICLSLLPPAPLLGEEEVRDVARRVLEERPERIAPRELVEKVSRVKNGMTCEEIGLPEALYQAHCQALKILGARDMDDLLLDALALDLRGQRRFTHLLVDEFQDVNPVQRKLVLHFSAGSRSLFVIGDADQSIYGFRGADAACFAALRREKPETETVTLNRNYRSTPEILQAATAVIRHNPGGERALEPTLPSGAPVRLRLAGDAFSEAVFIAKEIGRMTGGMDMLDARGGSASARAFSEIGVLARTRRQLELIESCLRHDDIPCVIAGREDYLSDDGVRGCLAFFRSLLAPETAALQTALRLAFGCSAAEAELAAAELARLGSAEALAQSVGEMGPLAGWAAMVRTFAPRVTREKPRRLLEDWKATFGGGPAMEKLCSAAVFDGDMPAFLNNLLLGQEGDVRRASGRGYASGAVRLMTLHGAKGLEFPVVFLAGVSRGDLPLEREGKTTDVEEERRLFFVGMTRAREELILTAAEAWSSFAAELPGEVQRAGIPARRRETAGEQLSFF